MARNNENTRHSNYVIRIVCEGDKTEPLFFTSLCDLYCKGNDGMDVRTIPQPHIPQGEETDDSPRGSYKGKKRKVKTDTKTETKLTYAEKDIKITDTVEYTSKNNILNIITKNLM